MTEADYISELRSRSPRNQGDYISLHAIMLADEAVRVFPESARLWHIRGNVIELSAKSCTHSLDEALECYVRAIDIDPQYGEAWEAAGQFHQTVLGNENAAQEFFREAERLRRTQGTTNAARVAAVLFTYFSTGGTLEHVITELPAFKVQIESAFHWLISNAHCTAVELQENATRFREVLQQKHRALSVGDLEKAVESYKEEIRMWKSLGLQKRDLSGVWGAVLDGRIDDQTARLEGLFGVHQPNLIS